MSRIKLEGEYRLPRYHKPSNRWRLTIHHAHGQKDFWWPANGDTASPRPEVIAASVGVQDAWRGIQSDWFWLELLMRWVDPSKDWSRPVWVNRQQCEADMAKFNSRQAEESAASYASAVSRIATAGGISRMLSFVEQPGALSCQSSVLAKADPVLLEKLYLYSEQDRLELLTSLQPAKAKVRTVIATTREALTTYLKAHEIRTELKAGDWIDDGTFKALRANLLGVFGLSTAVDMHEVRETPVTLDAPLVLVDRERQEELARYWHRMPEGVDSERTVRNYLHAARSFFKWCAARDYAFTFADDTAKLFTAQNVKRQAEQYDPQRIRRILAQAKTRGGIRLKLYSCLALLNGYGQTDCCEIAANEYFEELGDRFIHRFRSKERRPKRGSRPIRIKHWIPPQLSELIDAERGFNLQGFLFNGERGLVLSPQAVTGVWERANEAAGDSLQFCQLRKMGYNAIKRLSKSLEVAEIWDGHSGGISEHYDDGIFEPVVQAQKLWAAELSENGIL